MVIIALYAEISKFSPSNFHEIFVQKFVGHFEKKVVYSLKRTKYMIELRNINYAVFDEESKKEKSILKDFNVKFPKNKLTVITGHNGSGKSTMIKLIMGILKPTSGEILFDGKVINDLTISERANLGITIAFQQPIKFKGLTVGNLLDLASKEKSNIPMACEYLAKVGLCAKDYINRELDDTLSGGELKRIELAVALAKDGDVMMFDEPEAGIDIWSFESLVGLFKDLKNKTIIIVSHQKKLLDCADYILLMSNFKEAELGKKEDMLEKLQDPQCRKLGGLINE